MSAHKSKCITCGYEWITGQHGGHSCAQKLLQQLNTANEELAATKNLLLDLALFGFTECSLEIMSEVKFATEKFPTWPTDPIHAVNVLGEEFGELIKAVLQCVYEPHKSTKNDVKKEAIQTAAMAIRFLQSLEKYKYFPSEQHTQDGFQLSQAEGGAQ